MEREDIIEGLLVIAKRRGKLFSQCDVFIIEAAIKELRECEYEHARDPELGDGR
jgi:hypothetical protein